MIETKSNFFEREQYKQGHWSITLNIAACDPDLLQNYREYVYMLLSAHFLLYIYLHGNSTWPVDLV